jgi:hypothetical protein
MVKGTIGNSRGWENDLRIDCSHLWSMILLRLSNFNTGSENDDRPRER